MSIDWRQTLLQLREEMHSAAGAAAEASAIVELDQSKVGRLSRVDALQSQAMAQASNDRRECKLRLLEAALARINSDDFGSCQHCNEPIDASRLEFDPTLLLCIDCARKSESR